MGVLISRQFRDENAKWMAAPCFSDGMVIFPP
jgi:hypothetical protein